MSDLDTIPNDGIMPSQFDFMRGVRTPTAYHRLWYAVLEDAVMLYLAEPLHWGNGPINRRIRLSNEARLWLFDDSPGAGSYGFVCDVLGYDAKLFRNGCLRARQAVQQLKLRASPRIGNRNIRVGEIKRRRRLRA